MTATTAAPGGGRPFFRFWLPWVILTLAGLSAALVWWWPAEIDRGFRVGAILWTIVPLTPLLLGLWVVGFSGWRWTVRLALVLLVPLAAGVAAWAVVRDVQFWGDMFPRVIFRWDRTHDDVLEAHRRSAGSHREWVASDLSGNLSTDFPGYRGRQRDGIVNGPPLARDWSAQPRREVWRQPVGGGFAGFVVAGNALVTIEQRRNQEVIVCYDRATGREVWDHAYKARFAERLGGPGPRATPTIADGDVYSLGATGMLVCLDAATGRRKWSVNILEDNDNIPWGMSGSPLVYDGVVVVNPGAQRESARGGALVAYDRATGKEVWRAGDARAGYSSPMLATLAGRRQVLLLDAAGLGGYDADSGRMLWDHPWSTYMDINVAQPVVLDGDRVFISSGYDVGCALLHVTAKDERWSVQEVWKNRAMRCKFTSPVVRGGYLYGLDDGILVCLDVGTGRRQWRGQRYGHGQLLLTDDLLVILGESGQLALVEATPDALRELGNIAALEGKTWNYPALADGKVFLRNDTEMACYDLTGP